MVSDLNISNDFVGFLQIKQKPAISIAYVWRMYLQVFVIWDIFQRRYYNNLRWQILDDGSTKPVWFSVVALYSYIVHITWQQWHILDYCKI